MAHTKRILVPIDFSVWSLAALRCAAHLNVHAAPIDALHVIEDAGSDCWRTTVAWREAIERFVAGAKLPRGTDVRADVCFGNPMAQVPMAVGEGYDLVVMVRAWHDPTDDSAAGRRRRSGSAACRLPGRHRR